VNQREREAVNPEESELGGEESEWGRGKGERRMCETGGDRRAVAAVAWKVRGAGRGHTANGRPLRPKPSHWQWEFGWVGCWWGGLQEGGMVMAKGYREGDDKRGRHTVALCARMAVICGWQSSHGLGALGCIASPEACPPAALCEFVCGWRGGPKGDT
jgi:hypothetical protein